MTDLSELEKTVSEHAKELVELKNKAMMTTDDYPASMGITYDSKLQSKVFDNAPYFRFLESRGRIEEVGTSNVAFYIEQDNSSIQFIDENADIPDAIASKYTEKADRMKTLVYPIDVGIMAEMGNDTIDLMEREIEKGYIKITNTIDNQLINGGVSIEGSSPDIKVNAQDKGFKGILADLTDNKLPTEDKNITDLKGKNALTTDAINKVFVKLVDEQGATPSAIVTSYSVAILLQKLVAKEFNLNQNDKVDIGLGHRVNVFNSVTGSEVPILVDKNINEKQLLIIDDSTVNIKRLMAPTVFNDLPTNKLGRRSAIVSFLTQQNTAVFKNALITGIDTSLAP